MDRGNRLLDVGVARPTNAEVTVAQTGAYRDRGCAQARSFSGAGQRVGAQNGAEQASASRDATPPLPLRRRCLGQCQGGIAGGPPTRVQSPDQDEDAIQGVLQSPGTTELSGIHETDALSAPRPLAQSV